ncbi:DinB family protein [Chitinophagaceae bacterium LWZ2-11]
MKLYPSLIDRLRSQHEAIENVIAYMNPARTFVRPKSDTWHIHDNIAHLTRYQIEFRNRIKKILTENEPVFERYNSDLDPEFAACRSKETWTLISELTEERAKLFRMISSLSEVELARTGGHQKFGKLDIPNWIEFFLLHEAHHIFTIFKLANDVDL